MTPGHCQLGPQGMVGKTYVDATKHCYILNMLVLGLMASEKKIFEGSWAI